MGTSSHSESRRSYSWLWDSHIPKNSKWLQENLRDMDGKVKTMIKLIEEDADSFARRAEMYYKKRPELMKFVEEFYRAYRALAERYDHAAFELRHAHRTMAAAFPNHVPYASADDTGSSTGEVEPHTPEMTHPFRAFFDSDDFHKDDEVLSSRRNSDVNSEDSDSGISRKSVKLFNMKKGHNVGGMKAAVQFSEDGVSHTLSENEDLKAQLLSEVGAAGRAGKAETEVENLKRTLSSIESEKDNILLQYNEGLKKLSSLEIKLSETENDASILNEKASRAEIEIKILKEALTKLEAERDASLLQYSQSSEKISDLENTLLEVQDDVKGLNWRAFKAETEATTLKLELSALAAEKETGLARYKKSLQMISALENKIALAEENSMILNEQTQRAENEVRALKEALTKLKEEKDDIAGRYEKCLETIAKMESEISRAQVDAKRVNGDIVAGAEKLKSMAEQRLLLETSNQSMQKEANNLMQRIAIKDQELSEKQNELEKLQTSLLEEQSRFLQVEASLETLRKLHSQSQEEQKNLTLELQNRLQMLKEMKSRNQNLQENIQQVREENQSLNELNKSSADSVKHLQDEIFTLKELKEKLENEVALQIGQVTTLQQEMCKLKEDIKNLNEVYLELLQQLQSAGLDPECIEASLRHLKEENASLKETCDRYASEKETLLNKMREMDSFTEKNAELRCSLSELNGKLEGSREVVQELQKSCHFYQDEKSALVLEKAIILSQLQITTQTMQSLLEKNTILESSLSGANTELEGLRIRSKSLEELCQLLKNEKNILQNERDALACQLENVEEKLVSLEKRFARLEERYSELEKEKESSVIQVKELKGSLSAEQQLHTCYVQATESRFTNLEKHVHNLQEENSLRKKDFEEELEKAARAQVEIYILQKFIKDLEEKNLSLSIECENHAEDSKLTDQLIRELESENLELQIETEFLLDDIQKLRVGIHRVSLALQFEALDEKMDMIETDQIRIPLIMDRIEALKSSVLSTEDEKHQLLIEKSVLLTLLGQLKSDSYEVVLEKGAIEQKVTILKEQNAILLEEKGNMEELNERLTWEVNLGKQETRKLYSELETRHLQLVNLESAFQVLQEEKSKHVEENKVLLDKLSNSKEDVKILEEQNKAALQEAINFSNLSLILESFSTEKTNEVKALVEDVHTLRMINRDLTAKIKDLGDQLEQEQAESTRLNQSVRKLQGELPPVREMNDHLNHQIVFMKEFLKEKMMETVEVNHKLKAAYSLNTELSRTVEDLKTECQESKRTREKLEMQLHEQSMYNRKHESEIKRFQEVNRNLESEISLLEKAIEEQKTTEKNLSSEMLEKNNEFKLWEAEAASFYFDFQVSSICEVLLQSKVHELTGACEKLEDENSAQAMKIEEMNEHVNVLESEIDGLKAHLSSYVPAIASLQDCVTSLELNAHARSKLCDSRNKNKKNFDMSGSYLEVSCEELEEKGNAIGIAVIGDLQEMQTRIKAVEMTLVEEINEIAAHDTNKRNKVKVSAHYPKPEPVLSSLPHGNNNNEKMQQRDEISEKPMSRKMKVDISETKSETLMKDILLDQVSGFSFDGRSRREKGTSKDEMLELWESVDKDSGPEIALSGKKKRFTPLVASGRFRDAKHKTNIDNECDVNKLDIPSSTTQGARGRKVLERLGSDADKLTNLHITVQELRKKVEMNKSNKRTNDHEFRRVKGQLQEVEEAIQELWNMNGQLQVDFQQSWNDEQEEAGSTQKKRVAEEAQKGSEKIGRLQIEVQGIQYILLRLENEKKSKEKTKFTGAMLRDFIYTGPRQVENKKKSRACWCARPRTPEHLS